MYGQNHIRFVQTMLRLGCKQLDAAVELYDKWGCASGQFDAFINEINEKLDHQSLKLLKAHCEVTDEEYIVLINTADDDITTLQQQFTSVELEYFYLLIHEIILSEEKRLTVNFCLNLTSALPSKSHFTGSQAEVLLGRCNEQGYFIQDLSYIYLGPRGVWEFMPYIQSKYDGYCKFCNLCSELVVFGSACASCEVMFHNHCLASFLRKHSTCPCCKADWVHGGEGDESDGSTMETGD